LRSGLQGRTGWMRGLLCARVKALEAAGGGSMERRRRLATVARLAALARHSQSKHTRMPLYPACSRLSAFALNVSMVPEVMAIE